MPFGERSGIGGGVLGLHAHDVHVRMPLPEQCDAGCQSSAADRHHDRLHVGHLLHDLEAHGALTGDDVGVVERVDEHGPGAFGELLGGHERLGDTGAGELDVGPVALGCGDLG